MSRLPEEGLGEETGMWPRARRLVGERMSYALADQVTYSFGNMVVAALFSRHAGAREFGMYILTQRTLAVVIQLCNVFSWGPYTFNMAGIEKARLRLYDGSMVTQQLLGCALSVALLWSAGRWASTPGRGFYYGVFTPLILTSIGILFREFTRRFYFAQMRFRVAFWADVATVGLQIAAVEWLAVMHRLNVISGLGVLSAAATVVSAWWVLSEWDTLEVGWRENLEDMRLNLKLGRWLFGGNMVFMISSQCNPWVLSAMLGGTSVGAYAVCESVVNIPRVALTSMQNVMAPVLARALANGGRAELQRMVAKTDRALLAGSVLFAAGIAAVGPWVARLIFKTVPSNSRVLLVVLALNFVAFAATMAQSYGLTALNKAGYTFYAYLAGLVVQVGVCVWLVRAFALPGAAAAMLMGSLIVLLVRQFYWTREMGTAEGMAL